MCMNLKMQLGSDGIYFVVSPLIEPVTSVSQCY